MKIKSKQKFSSEFKSKVAIEAIKEQLTIAEISKKYNIHARYIYRWKSLFLEQSSSIFNLDTTSEKEELSNQVKKLHEKIGKLEMEKDFLLDALKIPK